MSALRPHFDLVHTPLERGVTLLEASAGTGKTYNLAGIVLRLLVETPPGADAPPGIERIAVVTFTEAATAELRDRVRGRVLEALGSFESGTSRDALLQRWLTEMPPESAEREVARRRLDAALRNFDLAAIFTIHGFSQRVLRERAFESGALFDVELVTDQSELIQAAADDFWRKQFGAAPPLLAALAASSGLSVDVFAKLVQGVLRYPDVRIATDAGERPSVEIWTELEATFAAAAKMWREARAELRPMFGASVKWPNKPFNDDEEIERRFAALDRVFDGIIGRTELTCLIEFAQENLRAHRNKRQKQQDAPEHPIFVQCAVLARLSDLWAVAVKREAVDVIRERLASEKLERKVQSFDDLLTRTRAALRSSAGPALVAEVRRNFHAALIDEFQDTDPVQWEIFRTLFGPDGAGEGPAPFLFLIGDPKQAIYGFRGADVFTYLAAAETADRKYSLVTNWRSERPLVRAVNAVFDGRDDAFVVEGIDFEAVAASARAEETPLHIDGRRPESLVFWLVRREDRDKPVDKADARGAIVAAVVAEILRLLSEVASIAGQRLQPRQIAVLVRSNHEAEEVHAALAAAGVPGVRMTREGVFAAEEATELFRVLTALANPGNDGFLRAAAATGWMGGMVAATDKEEDGVDEFSGLREQMSDWLATWETRGFAVAFRRLLAERGVRAALLARPDGERALTNLLHLGQLLHAAADAGGLGVGALLQWFAHHLGGNGSASDEHLLRLERDDEAVQILTMHRSKGLEYEVVFCPFCWDGVSEERKFVRDGLQIHDAATRERVLHLGPTFAGELLEQRHREELAENARLFYVALTRAIRRCYVAWGALKSAETSAPAWLLHRDNATRAPWPLDFKTITDDSLRNDLLKLAKGVEQGTGPVIAVEDLPGGAGPEFRSTTKPDDAPAAREFTREMRDDWRVLAFSSMTSGAEAEMPDYDSGGPHVIQETAPAGMFAFPAGTRAGTCLHKIFERLDFPAVTAAMPEAMVSAELRAHGIDPVPHLATVTDMLREVVQLPLPGAGQTFRLADVTAADRLNELEFHCPLKSARPEEVAKVLRRHGQKLPGTGLPERIGELKFHASGGLLTGFIDLVVRCNGKYYLLDWKSNWLGNAFPDYAADRLAVAMTARLYPLQYLLYAVALDRWLRARLGGGYSYEENFGGVFYVFLRGVDRRHPGTGLFADRPPPELISELGEALLANQIEEEHA